MSRSVTFKTNMMRKSICIGTIYTLVCLVVINGNGPVPMVTGPVVNLRDPEVTLTCAVDVLNDTVFWKHGDVEKFSCDFPYAAGTCMQADNYDGYVDTFHDVLTIRFNVVEDVNDRNWTCVKGNITSEPFDLDTGSSPAIIDFSISEYDTTGNGNVMLTCSALSDVELDLFSIVQVNCGGDRATCSLVNEDKLANQAYNVTVPVRCTDDTFSCCVINKYGYNCSSITIPTNCSVEVKQNLTTFEILAEEGDESALLRLFFTGKPFPPFTWYGKDANGTMSLLTNYRTAQYTNVKCNVDNTPCMNLRIIKPIQEDTGYYVIHINETTSGLYDMYEFLLNVTAKVPEVEPPVEPGCAEVPSLTFGQGIGAGIGIGIASVFFLVGVVYGFRKS